MYLPCPSASRLRGAASLRRPLLRQPMTQPASARAQQPETSHERNHNSLTCPCGSQHETTGAQRAARRVLWASALVGIAEYRGTDFVEMIPHCGHNLPVAFRGWLDSEGPQQRRGRLARVSCFPKRGVQPLVSKVVKDQVNYAPGVEGFFESLGLLMAGFGHQAILFPASRVDLRHPTPVSR